MSRNGFPASLGLAGALAITCHSFAFASELPSRHALSQQFLFHEGESLQEMLSESEQLLDQSVSLDLEEVIHKTIINNPRISQAVQLVKARKSQVAAEKRKWNPTLTFSRTSQDPMLGKDLSTLVENYKDAQYVNSTDTNIGFVAARLNWNFLDQVRYSSIKRSISLLESQELILNILCRSLILEVQSVYYRLVENRKLINTYSSIYERNSRELRAVLGQYKAGIISLGDVAQQRTLLLNQLNELLSLVALQIKLASELAVLIGMPPGSSALPAQEQVDSEEWPLSLEETMQEGLELREEILLALSDSKASSWQARTILNKYLPVFNLSINGYGKYSQGLFGTDAFNSSRQDRGTTQATDLSIGLGLTWTPFDGGSNLALSNVYKDQAKADLIEANSRRDQVGNQIRDSYGQYLTAKTALAKAEEGLKIASLSVDIASERYSAGIGSITTSVQATEMLGRASSILSQTRVSYFDSIAQLYRYSAQWPLQYKQAIVDGLSSLKVSQIGMGTDASNK